MHQEVSRGLFAFLKKSPTAFHAVDTIKNTLKEAGFAELEENVSWKLEQGKSYFVTRNESSIIAFRVGENLSHYSFQIAASHSDSPTFKVKENAELEVKKKYVQLNTEGYGGMVCSSWFDRPLSIAGRVLVKGTTEGQAGHKTTLEMRLVAVDRDLVLIPNVAIHMNRKANEGVAYNKQIDLLPLFGGADCKVGDFKELIAKELGVSKEDICGSDLYLYNRMEPSVWGAKEEFISAPQLDDLQCAYGTLQGFLQGQNKETVQVYACFDNEEVGSATKQGAGSTFLQDTLQRVNLGLGKTEEEYYRAIASSFMVSADNAHAVHPNHPEKTDAQNCVYMNEGIVVKSNAAQKYTSDAVSVAVFRQICEKAGVPVQFFANRSDEAGGSTLGNISTSKVSIDAVDIGLPQLAMHSAYETAGVKDTQYLIDAMKVFYSTSICKSGNQIELK